MGETNSRDAYDRIFAVIRRIPRGRVATYGQIATLAGLPGHARQVGYALRNVGPKDKVPWQRVVAAGGRIATRMFGSENQRDLLQREGVKFTASGKIDLDAHLWDPGPDALAGRPIKQRRPQP